MIESLQPVAAVMTGETCLSHRFAVVCEKRRIRAPMTIGAGAHHSRCGLADPRLGWMTGSASQRLTGIVALVACKAKAELIMRHLHKRGLRQARLPSFVIGMASGTIPRVGKLAMQSLRVCYLLAHLDMAFRAAGSVRPSKRCMAPVALRFEICMRRHVGDGTVERMLRAERARTKRHGAKESDRGGETDQQHKQCRTAEKPC